MKKAKDYPKLGALVKGEKVTIKGVDYVKALLVKQKKDKKFKLTRIPEVYLPIKSNGFKLVQIDEE